MVGELGLRISSAAVFMSGVSLAVVKSPLPWSGMRSTRTNLRPLNILPISQQLMNMGALS